MRHRRLSDLTMHFDADGRVFLRSQAASLGARVPPPAVAILSLCSQPRTRDEVAQALGPPMAGLYDGLVDAGFLVAPDAADATPAFFANFAGLEIHRRMLADQVRVDAYARAIQRAVQPGMAVLDAGTGSGLLALLAARAGARVVYAVDNSDVLELAAATVTHLGLQDTVRIVRGDFARVALPEPVDLIVSETFGALALAEGSVPDLAACAARHLRPGGRVLPDGVSLHLAPVGSPDLLDQTLGPFGTHHGVDFAPLRAAARQRGRVVDVPVDELLHPGQRLVHLPYPSSAEPSGRLTLPLRAGTLTGLVGWFDVHDGDHTMLSTAPHAPSTHWRQTYLPLDPVDVAQGDTLTLSAHLEPAPDDRRSLQVHADWSLARGPDPIQAGSGTWRVR